MRSGLLFTLILCLGLPAWAASPEISQGNPSTANPSRYEVLAYQEDFESGAAGWTHYDGTISPNNWHVHDYDGTQGNVWWMGDPALASGDNIGGYYNHQYLVLDTPARIISTANATLTFKMRLGLEDPSPSGDYDGWDSANIRISTNGGSTWSVIMGIPAYHYNNSYAFGYEHGEGMGIPAWGGMVTNWTTATFDLAAYVGQSVKIRFAFASDPATSTVDQPNMFGFMVDDISFGGYTNNGVDDGQMTFSSLVPLGGDLWHLATQTDAPSPTHVMKNQNAQGSYNNNMLNYLLSPSITLPASGAIRADFQIMGSFSGPGTFPDAEYWGWEISVDNGSTWNAMSNPYANPNGNNYVYSDVPTGWSSMTESFNLNGMISDFAGQSVKFRWFFSSNATAAQGSGIMIDDFKILNDIVLPAPTELTAIQIGTNVSLSWISPVDGVSGHNIYRDQIMISQVSNTTFNYVDMNVDAGMHSYYVTAMYGTNESMPSNSAQVTVLTPGYTELQYDDGSSEMGLNVGYSHQMAVYYNHGSELILKYAKVYLHNFSPSSLIVRAKDVGADGMPGDNLAQVQYPVSSQVQGWNYILFPEIEIPDGAFYLSILEIPNPSSIGLDTDNSGHSFVNMGSNAGWTAYTAGEIMIRAIVETSSNEITQNISLTGGWNLVSLNVSPSDHTLPTLLAPISSQIQQVKGTEGIYIPGNPYSTLSALTDGKAYNIQVNSNATCSITGTQIPFDTTLALSEGWNLTAYLPQNPMAVATAMQSISNWLQQVKGSDGVYIPGNPYSSLSTMYPGKGYWIQLTGAHDLIYPYGRAVAAELIAPKPRIKVTELPSSMVLLARCNCASAGDLLIAKVNGQVRGAQKLIAPEGFPAALLQIYTETANEEISLWLLRADGSEEKLANHFSSQPNSTLGSYPEFIILKAKCANEDQRVLLTQFYGCYPNPFNPGTTISFNIAEETALIRVKIYNQKGQIVRKLIRQEYPHGEHSLFWDGMDDKGRALSSGMYMIDLQAGKYRKIVKVLISK